MSLTGIDTLALNRAVGDGWCLLARGALRGESLLVRAGSAGIGGEEVIAMNWAVVHGPDGVPEAIGAFAQRMRDRAIPGLICVAAAAAAEARPAAQELALAPGDPIPLMVCPRDGFRPGAARHPAEHVTSEAGAREVAEALAESFAVPIEACAAFLGTSWRDSPEVDLFMSRVDGQAAAALATARVGEIVGVYAMGTRPDLRRRGAGAAVLTAAMRHHVARGAQAFVLQASSLGEPLYRALGYETVEQASVWLILPGQTR
jgi:hypothetical protein